MALNRKTIYRYYNFFRQSILCISQEEMGVVSGEVELDENYFGGRRVPGKRGRGASEKTPVFGL